MAVESIKCLSCGGDIEIKDGKNVAFCPYCGSKVKVDDGVERTEHTEHVIDEAKVKEVEYKTKKLDYEEREDIRRRKLSWVDYILIAFVIIALLSWVKQIFF